MADQKLFEGTHNANPPSTRRLALGQAGVEGAEYIEWGEAYSIFKDDLIIPLGEDLQTYITANRMVNLQPITYTISTAITIPDGTTIRGVQGKTKFKAANGSILNLIELDGAENITIENIDFEGYSNNTTVLASLSDVKSKTGIGTQSGIYITGNPSYFINICGCNFGSFTEAGIHQYNTLLRLAGVNITDCYFYYCYIGIYLGSRAEYGKVSNCSFNNCQIGIWCDAGNVIFNSIHSDENQVGAVISGLIGVNDSHVIFTGCTFNHNDLFSVICTTISNGATFTGCHIFDGYAYIDNSIGFNFIGGILSAEITFDKGLGTIVGNNSIQSTVFYYGDYGSGTINIVGSPAPVLILRGNYYITGENNSSLNN